MIKSQHSLNHEDRLPEMVSQQLQSAIQGALKEEKVPLTLRILKIVLCTGLSTTLLILPFALFFREQMTWVWQLASVVWMICFAVGFSLYFYPQPRLSVPGYWQPFVFAKILVGMTLLTWIQVLLCPSFVFLNSENGFVPFAPITEWFMSWGGMKMCMLSCGLIFASVGGVSTFLAIRKVILRSQWSDLLRALGVAYITQIPIILVQVVDPSLRPFAGYWAIGSILGLVFMLILVAKFPKTRISDYNERYGKKRG